ncbi:MAG TPA: UvrD-helicase domain-containing protein, partial [Acidimicrobiales bacterium]
MTPFDLCGPLPTGVTLLEASAGTGKTFTIAGLTARYVAEGTPIDRILVVTFTRMATSELRERVRDRLVMCAEGLGRLPDGAGDEIVRLLADGPPEVVALRRERLARAVAEFDAATIDTTHGFCLHVLSGLGVAGDVEPGVTLVEDARDVLDQVVDDLYIRKFFSGRVAPPFGRRVAVDIGLKVLGNPGALVVPDPDLPEGASPDDPPAMRRSLARALVEETNRRKRSARILTYDDLLSRLRDTLADEVRGEAARRRLRQRYDVALVDEFQDTDPVQWEIMQRAFGAPGSTLVLIGDPKQAIYAFRGADVFAYLDAAGAAQHRHTLGVNWRSDQGLIDAYDALFAGAQLGHAGIEYRTVRAADAHADDVLPGAPLRFRVLDRRGLPVTDRGYTSPAPAREAVARDVAGEAVALLSSGAPLRDGRPVAPGDLAVLVHTNKQGATVRDALLAAGVPAVAAGGGTVFATTPAEEWLRLLEALDQPTSRTRGAAAALTAFVGWTPVQVATAGEDAWEDLHARLHEWAALLRRRGVAALLENVTSAQEIPSRVLGRVAGERFLTDLRHVGELLHAAAVAEGLGAAALTTWLRTRIDEADDDVADEDRNRRLESDAAAVQVLTIHRSKGLEFPVVYCPYAWDAWLYPQIDIPVFHDAGVRTIDVGGDGSPGFRDHRDRELSERRGEDLRLLYVALTRARHQATLWWAGTSGSKASSLGRLLFGRVGDGSVSGELAGIPSDEEVFARVAALGPCVSATPCTGTADAVWERAAVAAGRLAAAVFDRVLDVEWRRTSYSGITAQSHGPTVGSESDVRVVADEDGVVFVGAAGVAGEGDEALRGVPLLLGDMPGGAAVGTVVHGILEATEFDAVDLSSELRAALDVEVARAGVDLGDPSLVVAGLRAVIEAPVVDGVRLRDVRRGDRLDELSFELPLVGGDHPRASLVVGDIAAVVRSWASGPDDPLVSYLPRLADPSLDRTLRGFLAGSLDLVMRLPDGRFVVADYKTNWLGSFGSPLTAWHYRPAALTAEMNRAHYPLQALLYTVALHRYLRWRVPGYDPARHLGGARYLFVRGMSVEGGT